MVATANVTAVVLASGLSRRFGDDNKLLMPLHGKPLARHCTDLVASIPFRDRMAVVPQGSEELAGLFAESGFEVVHNPIPDAGQGASLALAASRLHENGPQAALILLADMPFVSAAHIETLIARHGDAEATTSISAGHRLPPVLFDHSTFGRLASLDGERGGKSVLKELDRVAEVEMPPEEAVDIDTPAALSAAEARR